MAVTDARSTYGDVSFLRDGLAPMNAPPGYGYSLPVVYGLWGPPALLPACRWFAAVKQRRTEWWQSYL